MSGLVKGIGEDKGIPLHHIKIKVGEASQRLILVDDPFETDAIADMLDHKIFVNHNREHRIWKGSYHGCDIMILSTGTGCPSAAIAMEEAIMAGAKTILSVSSGFVFGNSNLKLGDLIISDGSCKSEGLSSCYLADTFPAIPDFELTELVHRTAKSLFLADDRFIQFAIGITVDSPYPQKAYKKYEDTPAKFMDLESSVLFTISQIRKCQCASILDAVVVDEDGFVQFDKDARNAKYRLALETLAQV